MVASRRPSLSAWPTAMPVVAVVALAVTWGRHLGPLPVTLVALVLAGAVLAAVHHAEVVAHRVGRAVRLAGPRGGGHRDRGGADRHPDGLRRPGVRVAGPRHRVRRRDDHLQRHRRVSRCWSARCGTASRCSTRRAPARALATVVTLATLSLVLPTFTTSPRARSSRRPSWPSPPCLAGPLRRVRVHADRPPPRLLPPGDPGRARRTVDATRTTPTPPTGRAALASLGLLLVALVAVVGLAKVESPADRGGRRRRRASRRRSSAW